MKASLDTTTAHPIVYCDHSVLVEDERGAGQGFGNTATRWKSQGARCAFSFWNLVEAVNGIGHDQALARARCLERLASCWLRDRRVIQREEVKRFFLQKQFGVPYEVRPSCMTFSQILYDLLEHSPNLPFILGTTPLDMVGFPASNARALRRTNQVREELPSLVRGLQQAQAQGKITVDVTFMALKDHAKKLLEELLPVRNPNGEWISREMMKIFLDRFEPKEYLHHCPSIAVEHYYSEYRRRSEWRPRKSDVGDLSHISAALPYVDVFITDDRDLRNAGSYAIEWIKQLSPTIKMARIECSGDQNTLLR